MSFLKEFIKLMKSEPINSGGKKRHPWSINNKKFFSHDEVKKLRRFCKKLKTYGIKNKKFSQIRNYFMIELGLNVGLRVEEMASLKHSNLLIEGERSIIILKGKGNKEREVFLNSDFKKICLNFIKIKQEFGYSVDSEAYLLNNLKGTKITKRALQKFFKLILENAKLPKYYSIHCLRHTYATFLLDTSGNIRLVQDQLGHSSLATTQVYSGVIEAEAIKAVEGLYK